MGQGTIRVSTSVLLELIADTIDLDVLRRRLLLPEQYRLQSLSVQRSSTFGSEAYIGVEATMIPDDALVTMTYQREPGETIELRQETTKLLKVEVTPGGQGKQ